MINLAEILSVGYDKGAVINNNSLIAERNNDG
jgi:hypothetical protein